MGPTHVESAPRNALAVAATLFVALVLPGMLRAQTSTISTISGNGGTDWAGDGGPATSASHATPSGIARDAAGNLFVAEADSNRVRKITPNGTISTVAGNGQATFTGSAQEANVGDGGPATAAAMAPRQLAVDAAGNLYLTDVGHNRIRKVTSAGVVSTVAGTGFGHSGDGGPAGAAGLQTPAGIAVDGAGNLYISTGNRIRKVTAAGIISTIAGTGAAGYGGDGGPATAASLRTPGGIAVDGAGNIYFADTGNRRVRKIVPSGQISTVVGGGNFRDDFFATTVDLARPTDVALDSRGYLYVVLEEADAVRKVAPDGLIGNAGGYFCPYFSTCPWNSFSGDGGDALKATLNRPRAIELDPADNLYVADTDNGRIRRITPSPPIPAPVGTDVFKPRVKMPVDSYPEGVAIGDFTGDGRNDVVLVTRRFSDFNPRPDDFKVLLYIQQPDGSLATPVKALYGAELAQHVGLVLTDLNHDGRKDIVIGHHSGLAVFPGNPAGTLTLSTFPAESHFALDPIVAMDVNGDGNMDIVAAAANPHPMQDGFRKHFGDGLGGFAPPQHERHDGWPRRQLVSGDLNSDGKPDLLARGSGRLDVEVFLHDGQSGFKPARSLGVNAGIRVSGLSTGDLNDDGRTDAAFGQPLNSPTWLHLFLQDGNQQLDGAVTLHAYDIPSQTAMADINGDGRTDLLVLHDWATLAYYQRLATGFAPAAKYALATHNGYGSSTNSLAIGDLDNDGCRDVAIADELEGLVILRGHNCVATPAVSDFDGDRQSDLLWFAPDTVGRIWPGAASAEATRVAAAAGWNVAAVGDFTGDGASDLFWRNCVNGASRIWLGAQESRTRVASTLTDKAWSVAASGDFTGDGIADLLWRHASGATLLWPSAEARQQRRMATLAPGWSAVSAGDYDGDGREDVFWRHAPTGANLVWRAGGLAGAQRVTAILDLAWRVAGSGDVDGDGKADLLWRHTRSGANALWRSADFSRRVTLQAMADAWTVAAVGDFDGDRRADIAWHHTGTGQNLVWKRGNPATALPISTTPASWRTTMVQNSCAAPPRPSRPLAPVKLDRQAPRAAIRRGEF